MIYAQTYPIEDFARLRPAWDQLNSISGSNPLLSAYFAEALIETFGTGRERIGVCSDSSGVVAIGIFTQTRLGVWKTFQLALSPLGLWLQRPAINIQRALEVLMSEMPGPVLAMGARWLDPDLTPRPRDTNRLRSTHALQVARVSIDCEFATYWSQRGRNLRHNLRRQRARLQRDGLVTSLQRITVADAVETMLDDFGRLESTGWKGMEGSAVEPRNIKGLFYRRVLSAACAQGEGCIYQYRIGEKIAAMDLCIRSADTLVILKTAYDESIGYGLSPAMLMRQESMALLFADGQTRRIEFYGPVMEWHLRLTAEVRTLYDLTLFRWRMLPMAARRLRNLLAQPAEVRGS